MFSLWGFLKALRNYELISSRNSGLLPQSQVAEMSTVCVCFEILCCCKYYALLYFVGK